MPSFVVKEGFGAKKGEAEMLRGRHPAILQDIMAKGLLDEKFASKYKGQDELTR